MVKFFSPDEEAAIVTAIQIAENNTSGEIRVHVEIGETKPALDVAARIFKELGMDKTADRNGVLILLEVDRREFAIIGDVGITKVVPDNFYDEERDILQQYFRRGAFADGITLAVERVGANLKKYFPYQRDDVNELPDEISYGGTA